MPQLLLCPHGHEWEAADDVRSVLSTSKVVCPVCGTAVLTNDATVARSKPKDGDGTINNEKPADEAPSLSDTFQGSEAAGDDPVKIQDDRSLRTEELTGYYSAKKSDDDSGTIQLAGPKSAMLNSQRATLLD